MSIVVIGGGVIGLNIAWSLRHRGHEVAVVERGKIGKSASGVNAGWITPSLSTPLASPGILKEGLKHAFDKDGALTIRPQPDLNWIKWLWRFYKSSQPEVYEKGVRSLLHLNSQTMDLFDKLKEDGVEFEMHSSGILALALKPEGLGWFTQLFDTLIPMGFTGSIKYLSGDEARELDPSISKAVKKAAYTNLDRHVNPDSLLIGLSNRLREMDVPIYENTPVKSIRREGETWILETSKDPIHASQVVVALGAATNQLLSQLNSRLPIIGGKGYSVELKGAGIPPKHALYLMESKLGLSPLKTGVRIAGVFEMPGVDDSVSRKRIELLVKQARPYLDGWTPDSEVDIQLGRAGLRPSTPDSLPFIGPVPQFPGLYVAAGHGMLGVTLAPATAEAITGMITDGKRPETLLPFRLEGRI